MGINFYWRYNQCTCCGRCDRLHIGKLSHGWEFGFEAHPDEDIASYRDWLEHLKSGGEIVDEYDETYTVEQFQNLVAKSKGKTNHTTYGRTQSWARSAGYLDDEGWSMVEHYFR